MKMLSRSCYYKIFNNVYVLSVLPVRKSALYVSGDKATETFVYVIPHIDYSEVLQHKSIIKQQLSVRKVNFDFEKLENLWTVYEELKKRKSELISKKTDISRELSTLIKTEPESDKTRKWKILSDVAKDNLKKLKVPLWSAEEAAIIEVLKLPNNLNALTPESEIKIIHEHHIPPKNKKDHLKIAKELNIVKYESSQNYYLKGDAAIFELGAKFYMSKILKKRNFVQFSNPDFVKSVIIEGCGIDHTNSNSSFILHHNEDSNVNPNIRLHLTGGASLFSYFAYHSKNVVYSKVFPLKYFTMGRQYVPTVLEGNGLFNVSQASAIYFFGATRNAEELNKILDELIDVLKLSYGQLGYHFRLGIVPADKLAMWESMRVVLEMYSTSLNSYVEIGNISFSEDFISKRLMFTYMDNKQTKFPHIISGTLLNVPKFLACVLEQNENFTVPPLFTVDNWSI